MRNMIRITESDLHGIVKRAVQRIVEDLSPKDQSIQKAWEEYQQMINAERPFDESEFDCVQNQKDGYNTPFGKAYCHSVTKDGVVDPMVFQVKSNTLRGMMGN